MKTLVAFLTFGLAACALLGGPPADPKEYPCGYNGVSCGNHMCCGEHEDCGSAATEFYGCHAGMCCWHGDPGSGNPWPNGKQRPQRPQFPEKR